MNKKKFLESSENKHIEKLETRKENNEFNYNEEIIPMEIMKINNEKHNNNGKNDDLFYYIYDEISTNYDDNKTEVTISTNKNIEVNDELNYLYICAR
jgi:hypothetical protein